MGSGIEEGFIAREFAEYVVFLDFSDLPADVIQYAKLCLLDSVGCTMGGITTNAGKILVDTFKRLGGNFESTLFGDGAKLSCVAAAHVNAMLNNALDFDEVSHVPISHAGSTIIPPAIAVAESIGADGKDLLTAIVAGYEVSMRIGFAVEYSKEQMKKVWGLGTWQIFGAVTAAGKLLGLNTEELVNALGVAGANAPVPSINKANFPRVTMCRNNYGSAAESGVLAALLAKEGFTGPGHIFEGDTGFWRMAGSDRCDFEAMTKGLGEDYWIKKIEFKKYPAARWGHTTIDAALDVLQRNRLDVKKIDTVNVRTFSRITRPPWPNRQPRTEEEAIVSLPYLIAVSILGIKPGLEWREKETMENSEVLKLAQKVNLSVDEVAEEMFPEKYRSTVEMIVDGKSYQQQVDFPKGSLENPMNAEEIGEKFHNLLSHLVGARKTRRVKRIIQTIEKLSSVKQLVEMLH